MGRYQLKDSIYLMFLVTIQAINCLRIHKFLAPKAALVGDNVHLVCEYHLDGESLYSLKWYKDETEFFRIEPKAKPGPIYFQVSGISVDKESSNGSTVILNNVRKETSGTIACEVSVEKTFQTVVAEQNFTVLNYEEAYLNNNAPSLNSILLPTIPIYSIISIMIRKTIVISGSF